MRLGVVDGGYPASTSVSKPFILVGHLEDLGGHARQNFPDALGHAAGSPGVRLGVKELGDLIGRINLDAEVVT